MKLIVETPDNRQVYGRGEELWARHNRPSVVRAGTFIDHHVSQKQLKILGQVSDKATDVELEKRLSAKDADVKKVVEDFAKEFSYSEEEPAPPAKGAKA